MTKKSSWAFGLGILAMVWGPKLYGDTRIDSLSSDPRMTEDLDLIWMYPQKVVQYQDTADFRLNNGAAVATGNVNDFGSMDTGSLASNQYEWGGVIDGKQKDIGVLGAYVNRPYIPIYSTVYGEYWRPVGGTTTWGSSAMPANKVDLFWAQSFGGADFGVRLNYGDMQNSGTDYARTFGAQAGIGFKGDGAFSEADFHAGYAFGNFENGATGVSGNGIFSLSLGSLLQHDMGLQDNLRLFGDFGLDQYQDTSGLDTTQTLATLGLALNHAVHGGKGLLTTGLVVNGIGGDNETNWSVGWNGSVEDSLTDWLILRAGLFKAIFDQQASGGVVSDPTIPNTVVFNIGAGFRWENWALDTRVGVKSLEGSIQNFEPGNGIAFQSSSNAGLVTLIEADLRYSF
jgi:hypothetical protein